ncbi:response regulator [bacterium]|nr:response regulator [bacterium]
MSLSDRLLLIQFNDPKFQSFLEKVGYELFSVDQWSEVQDLLGREPIDAILFDGSTDTDSIDFLETVKNQPKIQSLPMFFFVDNEDRAEELQKKSLDKVEVFVKPYSIGAVASKIATEVRLRKFAGEDEVTATLSETNAALRDLTLHLKKDLEEARSIQQNLLPKVLPEKDEFEIAFSYEPLEEVGGDWFFIEEVAGNKVSVQIGDVTGHGLSAAFIGSMTKMAMVAAGACAPHELLQKMNGLLEPQLPDGKFVTMFSYLYEYETGLLHYARAGHPPALLLRRREGKVLQLKGEGFPLGFLEGADYSLGQEIVEKDDILIIYTDAFPESTNMEGAYYGIERLEKFLLELPREISAEDVIQLLKENFDDFREGRLLKDDATVVALRRKNGG